MRGVLRARRGDVGVAALEVVALYPFLILLGTFALQAGAAMWTVSLADEAARTAARASALGRDPASAAADSLPDGVRVQSVTPFGAPEHGVEIVIRVPRVSPLPTLEITRRAYLP